MKIGETKVYKVLNRFIVLLIQKWMNLKVKWIIVQLLIWSKVEYNVCWLMPI